MLKSRHRHDGGGVALIVSIVVVVIVAVVLIFHFISRREPKEIKNFQQLVMQVEKLNTEISDREQKIQSKVQQYNANHPQGQIDTTGMANFGLSPEQAQLLAKRVSDEKDISYRGLLQNVLDLNHDIDSINKELQEVKSRLRPPYEAKKGDTHLQVCLNFLTKDVGLSDDEAMDLIKKQALQAELLPGFEVWNYYGDGVFGTFVTQGSAKMTPQELARATKRKIDTERKKLTEAVTQKEGEVQDLQSKRDELQKEIASLEQERASIMDQMKEMASKNEKLDKQLNSVYYTVATFKDLEKLGIIRKPTFGKWEVDNVESIPRDMSLNLNEDNRITFTASSLSLGKISDVVLFPRFYDKDADYSVKITDDKQSCTLILQKPEKFKLTRLAIAVN